MEMDSPSHAREDAAPMEIDEEDEDEIIETKTTTDQKKLN